MGHTPSIVRPARSYGNVLETRISLLSSNRSHWLRRHPHQFEQSLYLISVNPNPSLPFWSTLEVLDVGLLTTNGEFAAVRPS